MSLTYHSTREFDKYFYGSNNYNFNGIYYTKIPDYVSIVIREEQVFQPPQTTSSIPVTTQPPKNISFT